MRRSTTSFGSQHVKGSQTHAKCVWEQFYHIFWSLRREMICTISPLLNSGILGVFVTDWLPMKTIPLGILEICSSRLKCNYLKNKNDFLKFLFRSRNLHQTLNILKKKMIVIANVFSKLQTEIKDLVKQLSWRRRFRTSFNSQHVNECQTLMKSAWEHFYHIFWSLIGKMTWKMPPLLNFEILGLFVNTLTADNKYPVLDCENLQFPIQKQLS